MKEEYRSRYKSQGTQAILEQAREQIELSKVTIVFGKKATSSDL